MRDGEAGRGVEEEESGGARAQEIEGAPARVARWWRWDSLQLATPPRLFPFFPPFSLFGICAGGQEPLDHNRRFPRLTSILAPSCFFCQTLISKTAS